MVRQSEYIPSDTGALHNKINKLEEIVRKFVTKMEDPSSSDEEDTEEVEAPVENKPICYRHEYIQDYLLEFSIYHQSSNYSQITLPSYAMPVSATTR